MFLWAEWQALTACYPEGVHAYPIFIKDSL